MSALGQKRTNAVAVRMFVNSGHCARHSLRKGHPSVAPQTSLFFSPDPVVVGVVVGDFLAPVLTSITSIRASNAHG
jgi:hypothetical protein